MPEIHHNSSDLRSLSYSDLCPRPEFPHLSATLESQKPEVFFVNSLTNEISFFGFEMMTHLVKLPLLAVLMALSILQTSHALVWPIDSKGSPVQGSIRTFFMNPMNLWSNRELYRAGYRQLNPAIKRVIRRCTGALNDNNTYAVTAKPAHLIAPSGDPHDYYSLARYFWPNASNPDGLPYMRADGYINPEIYLISDPAYVDVMFQDIMHCSLAYFFTTNETYSEVAVRRVRDWFINPQTRMNPSLQYANWVKGTPVQPNTGNGTGISVSSNSGGLLGKVYYCSMSTTPCLPFVSRFQ
jgi:hypothetical protein